MNILFFLKARLKSVSFWVVLLVIAVVIVVSAMRLEQRQAGDNVSAKRSERPLPVKAAVVRKETIQDWVYGNGTARTVRREYLVFESQGKITYIKKGEDGGELREGDRVRGPREGEKHGELLASLDNRDQEESVNVAKAALEQARKQKIAAEADRTRAVAQQDVADANFRRDKELFEKEVISQSQYEISEAKKKEADSALKAAEARIEAAESEVKSSQARLQQANVALERTHLYAPIDGIIAYLNVKEGYYFSANFVNKTSEEDILRSVPMVIIDPSQYEITLDIPSFDGSRVKEGQDAYVLLSEDLRASAISGKAEEATIRNALVLGKVFAVNPAVNPGGRSTQVKVRTTQGADLLLDGMFVTCWIVVEEKAEVITAPYNALIFRNQEVHVFVVDERSGAVQRRGVRTGIYGISRVEILDGAKEGKVIVTEGRHRLTNGACVEVINLDEEGDK